jgi:hypothetical protein
MQALQGQEQIFRRQVQRIMASQEFASSRQLRDFLHFVSEAALEGATHLDQSEIAAKILNRSDFNPVDDASVRKLATALRQRLDRYYESEGAQDPVRIRLPLRSYVPLFELYGENGGETPAVSKEAPLARRLILGGGLAVAALTAGGALWRNWRRSDAGRPVFVIHTRRGDLMHERNDVARDALLLGPAVSEADDVTARLVFTPERATQQAGLLIYGDADRYVKLGRQFLARPQLEFGMEVNGRYAKPPGTFAYDPEAQTNQPVWLSIRRRGAEFSAFVSSDAITWKPCGNVLTMPVPFDGARAAIFAHNGRSDAPSATARFDRVSAGLCFHNRVPGPLDVSQFPGWRLTGAGAQPRLDGECLAFDFPAGQSGYSVDFIRAAPPGDWVLAAKLDFLSIHGSTAGLLASGPKGRFRFIRWDLDGGSITAEHLINRQVNRKDFEGAPPIWLRLVCRQGVLRCSYSRDDVHFHDVPLNVPLGDLGGPDISVGLHVSTSSWKQGEQRQPARFYYVYRELDTLTPA